jgi:N-acetylneuraminic acid mutarotase
MAQQTKQPDVLRELFAALDNDPTVIAECLARPALAEGLTRDLSSHRSVGKSDATAQKPASRWPGVTLALLTERFDGLRDVGQKGAAQPLMLAKAARYKLPTITDTPSNCAASWTATTLTGAPDARTLHTAVWTGSEMIVWGGSVSGLIYNTGGRYNPATDSWTPTSIPSFPCGDDNVCPADGSFCPSGNTCALAPREAHTAVWTGTEMIVWGGDNFSSYGLNTGGRYNPSTDTWTPTSLTNAPDGRRDHSAVWTGSEMIVWGGATVHVGTFDTGGRYDPSTDTWTATSTTNAPSARPGHTAVWTGSEMIIWSGDCACNTGGRYNPSTDSWTATNTTNAPAPHRYHRAVWAGKAMIVWGGQTGVGYDGGRYDPGTDTWTPISTINAPSPRYLHTAVWTGDQMIVWGGYSSTEGFSNTGGAYDPSTDTWTVTATTNAPVRVSHTAVWTGTEMIVWGGSDNSGSLNTGGRYSGEVPLPAAFSRKNHGGTDRDQSLSLGGKVTVECRSGGGSNAYQFVVTFANAVTFNPASVTSGAGTVTNTSGSGTDTATIDLTGVTNAQTINVTLFAVTDDCGTRDVTVPLSILIGDTTGDGSVNSADISQTKSRSGQTVGSTNFRSDVTADGSINSADISLVKSKSGTALP